MEEVFDVSVIKNTNGSNNDARGNEETDSNEGITADILNQAVDEEIQRNLDNEQIEQVEIQQASVSQNPIPNPNTTGRLQAIIEEENDDDPKTPQKIRAQQLQQDFPLFFGETPVEEKP